MIVLFTPPIFQAQSAAFVTFERPILPAANWSSGGGPDWCVFISVAHTAAPFGQPNAGPDIARWPVLPGRNALPVRVASGTMRTGRATTGPMVGAEARLSVS